MEREIVCMCVHMGICTFMCVHVGICICTYVCTWDLYMLMCVHVYCRISLVLPVSAVSVSTIFYSSLFQISTPLSECLCLCLFVSQSLQVPFPSSCVAVAVSVLSLLLSLSLSPWVSIFFCIFEIPHPLISRSRCPHQYFFLSLCPSVLF